MIGGFMQRRYIILALLLFSTLVQCGGEEGPSKQVDVTITPSRPVAQTSNITIPITTTTSVTITAPFVAVQVSLSNNSAETLTVTGIRYEAEYDFTDANNLTTLLTAGPNDISNSFYTSFAYDYFITSVGCAAVTACNQTVFAEMAGGTGPLTLSAKSGANTIPLTFYLSSLPKNNGKNFTYRIKVTLLGYFGTTSSISARFNKIIYLTTL